MFTHSVLAYDARTLKQLHQELQASGAVEVERCNDKRRNGRIQSRGKGLYRDPHVISIEERLDLNHSDPQGPAPFEYLKPATPP